MVDCAECLPREILPAHSSMSGVDSIYIVKLSTMVYRRTRILSLWGVRLQKAYSAVIVAQPVGLKLPQALQQADPKSQ
jgi:hypothetical protein